MGDARLLDRDRRALGGGYAGSNPTRPSRIGRLWVLRRLWRRRDYGRGGELADATRWSDSAGDGRRDPVGKREEDTGKRFEAFGGGNAGRSGRATAASGSGTPASARGRGEARPRGKEGGRGSLPHRGKPTVLGRRRKAVRSRRGGDPKLAAAAMLGARRLRGNPREAAGLYRAATRRPGEQARGEGDRRRFRGRCAGEEGGEGEEDGELTCGATWPERERRGGEAAHGAGPSERPRGAGARASWAEEVAEAHAGEERREREELGLGRLWAVGRKRGREGPREKREREGCWAAGLLLPSLLFFFFFSTLKPFKQSI
jgi:hypothetical protein